MGHKYCELNGTWFRHPESNQIWSNYTTCVNLQDLSVSNVSYILPLARKREIDRLKAVTHYHIKRISRNIEHSIHKAKEYRKLLSYRIARKGVESFEVIPKRIFNRSMKCSIATWFLSCPPPPPTSSPWEITCKFAHARPSYIFQSCNVAVLTRVFDFCPLFPPEGASAIGAGPDYIPRRTNIVWASERCAFVEISERHVAACDREVLRILHLRRYRAEQF